MKRGKKALSKQDVVCDIGVAYFAKVGANKYLMVYPN